MEVDAIASGGNLLSDFGKESLVVIDDFELSIAVLGEVRDELGHIDLLLVGFLEWQHIVFHKGLDVARV